jgi:hypothetical protein
MDSQPDFQTLLFGYEIIPKLVGKHLTCLFFTEIGIKANDYDGAIMKVLHVTLHDLVNNDIGNGMDYFYE